ncbi:MAG: Asp-tRNA(Asn)/Glu-tRNA(Gln) amidotransferase subunit GatB [Bdellovibrionaceae bacterium]|nr:Asp-tRNA(Asn)/Glu-tRNA(Gln) amidotransferase subunit GatB [Pseudobdellovibrionaceae bacterium]
MSYQDYECVIGLEIHAQLKTQSKMFSADSTQFEAADNAHTSIVSVGMPGALPTPNRLGVELAIKTGLALGCTIRERSVFARKNYFYPDLPKGYQISQYDEPLCENGRVIYLLDGAKKEVRIVRAHLEEDAGKSVHIGDASLINFNRSGIPLLEVVSAPDMRSPREAAQYAKSLRQILRYIGVCDGNLEEGSMRCDCNISVRKKGETRLGTKVEIKNINSFRFVEKALEYEFERQVTLLHSGQAIVQETRLWDPDKNRTFSMRIKEDADDYRYFPDPDLLPLVVSSSYIEGLKKQLPELPLERFERFQKQYGLPSYDAEILTEEKEIADYFERAVVVCGNPKAVSNWMMTDLMRLLNDQKLDINQCPISSESLGELVQLIDSGTISGKIGKTLINEMWDTGRRPKQIVEEKGLVQISDEKVIEGIIDAVLKDHSHAVAEYRSGKTKSFGFLVGQIMKACKGQANPQKVNELLKKKLES